VSLDQVIFKNPINVGELVSFRANVNYVGNSSMEVGVKVVAEDLHTKEKRHTNSCYFTMVAVDDNGKAVKVPPLEIKSEFEQKLYEAGKMRKQMRQEIARKNQEITDGIDNYNPDITET